MVILQFCNYLVIESIRKGYSMEVKVCKNCRRLFKYMYGPDLCPECIQLAAQEKEKQKSLQEITDKSSNNTSDAQNIRNTMNKNNLSSAAKSLLREEEAKFEQVKDYIIANPRASVAKIAEVNDIPPTKLFEWIKDDRLEFSDESEYAWFTCEKCGAKIRSGRVCARCKIK
jgi:uncharacterized Zn finger protein (UPF0148 family)